MIKAVFFDLDGTLVNSIYDLADSTNFALSEFGFPTHETDEYKYMVGNGMKKLIERAVPAGTDTETIGKIFDSFFSFYGEHYADKTAAYNGIEQLLEKVKADGMKIAVISNKMHSMTVAVVNNKLGDIFDAIGGITDAFPPKPDPALTLKIMKELNVTPDECLFVGDSAMDMQTAKNSGAVPVGVLWGYRTKDELLSNGAKYTVSAPSEITDIIAELNNE